jgi:hypothetical protein
MLDLAGSMVLAAENRAPFPHEKRTGLHIIAILR